MMQGRKDAHSGGGETVQVTLSLVLVQVLFGLHYYAAKVVVQVIPPTAWAFLRVMAAAMILLPLALGTRKRRLWPGRGDLARLALLSLLGVVINQLCFVEGIARTTLSHSSLINCAIPVLTLLMALAMGQEHPGPFQLAGIGLALLGGLTLFRLDDLVWNSVTRGDLLTLVNATSFSLFLVLSRPVIRRQDPLVATGILFGCGSLILLPLAAPSLHHLDPSAWPVWIWLWGLYIILGCTVLTYGLNYFALKRASSSLVALFIFLQPLLASSLDVWRLGATWDLRLSFSALLIMTGVGISIWPGRRHVARPSPVWQKASSGSSG